MGAPVRRLERRQWEETMRVLFWTHIVMAYAFTFWTCYTLLKEYEAVATMRLHFLAAERRRPDQFTVLVKNVPPDPDETVSERVEHFFLVNHPDHYLTHQVLFHTKFACQLRVPLYGIARRCAGFHVVVINANKLAKLVKVKKKNENWLDYYRLKYSRNQSQRPMTKTGFLGLYGVKVDAIDYQTAEIERLSKDIAEEQERVKTDPKCIMPAAFVSFKTRWAAAVCAQTQQSRNPTLWLTEWASEPRDIYWDNLAIPYVSLTIRRLIVAVAFFFLTFFFMIPITAVQSLANIEGIEKRAPFLKPITEVPFIKSLIQGVLPGIVLKIFLIVLPTILMMMSKFEGFLSISALERRSAMRYYIFNFVNVFLVSVIAGTAFQQLNSFLHQSPSEIPTTIGVAIPMKATFFITYVMVDGWAGVAGEILRLKPLIFYHLKNFFLVKTEKDREAAMDPGSIGFDTGEPQIQLYFLLGLVYAVVTPVFLPFILVFFALAYLIFRHQCCSILARCTRTYNCGPYFLTASSAGINGTKGIVPAVPLLLVLMVLTFFFHRYCKGRFESAFVRYPLQEAMMKDTLERAREPNLNLKGYLQYAYVHPVFKDDDDGDEDEDFNRKLDDSVIVPTKRQSRRNTPLSSKVSGGSSPSLPDIVPEYP
ncbi:Calcium permeable stress-gated cation channel 1 [Orobanche gracilis]